jgi:probable phosphoglycerate mutase
MTHHGRQQQVVLVRHGETEWSRSGQHTGRTDVPLTEVGRGQADRVAAALAGRSFALALASPMGRARETCERAGLGDLAEITADLREWDYGAYEGRTTADIRKEVPKWSVWTHPITGGESSEQVGARADSVIDRVVNADGDVVLFAHGHVLRILSARWLGLEASAGRLLGLDTATISTLGFERENRVIRRWNDDCHLRAAPSGP